MSRWSGRSEQSFRRFRAGAGGADWRITLARTPHFAEYILYGIFVEHVLALEKAGHVADGESLSLTRWQGEFEEGRHG